MTHRHREADRDGIATGAWLTAARAERLPALRRVDLGNADDDVHHALGRFASSAQRVAVGNADDGAGEDGSEHGAAS